MKKKLIFFSYNLGIGGIETALLNLLNRIDLNKYDVTLVLEKKEGELLSQVNKNIYIYEFKVSKSKNILFRKAYNFTKRFMWKLKNKNKYDFSCCYATYSMMANKLSKIASQNSSIYIHNNYLHLYNNDISKVRKFFDFRKLEEFRKIIFVSNESMNDLIKIYPEFKEKSLVINNFIDNELILEKSKEKINEKKHSKKLFVSVGRLEEQQKRISRLIKLFEGLKKEDVELWIIGDGPDRRSYETYIKNSKNIKMLGKRVNPYPYIKLADYIILTSDYEGFPVVYMEAMTLNKPIITTVNVSDDFINIKDDYGVIISKDEKMIDEVKEIIKKGFTPKKLDYIKTNKEKMNKLEQIFDEVI